MGVAKQICNRAGRGFLRRMTLNRNSQNLSYLCKGRKFYNIFCAGLLPFSSSSSFSFFFVFFFFSLSSVFTFVFTGRPDPFFSVHGPRSTVRGTRFPDKVWLGLGVHVFTSKTRFTFLLLQVGSRSEVRRRPIPTLRSTFHTFHRSPFPTFRILAFSHRAFPHSRTLAFSHCAFSHCAMWIG